MASIPIRSSNGRLYQPSFRLGLGLGISVSNPEVFLKPNAGYIPFTHIQNLQPKFDIGLAAHPVLHREHSRIRKYSQLSHERLVQVELSLRFWQDHGYLYAWSPIPLFTEPNNFRALELALIQEWQPELKFPFICQ